MTNSKRLLAIRFSALGDVAMTIPVIYSFAKEYPDLHIYVLTKPFMAQLLIHRPENVHIISADLKEDYKGFFGIFKLAFMLRSYHFDYIADLHDVLRSRIIDFLMRPFVRKIAVVDKDRRGRRKLLADKVPQKSYIERYRTVFENLGFSIPTADLSFKSIFTKNDVPEPPIEIEHPAVGIAPFARYYTKEYPKEKMKRVAELLTHKGINVYLFGAAGKEADEMNRWAEELQNCTSVAGRFPLRDELSAIANLDLMVSMDSSNQHLAALTGKPVLSIWGGTVPSGGFLAYNQEFENTLCASLPCQPCSIAGSDDCPKKNLLCMNSLSEQTVADKILSILKR